MLSCLVEIRVEHTNIIIHTQTGITGQSATAAVLNPLCSNLFTLFAKKNYSCITAVATLLVGLLEARHISVPRQMVHGQRCID